MSHVIKKSVFALAAAAVVLLFAMAASPVAADPCGVANCTRCEVDLSLVCAVCDDDFVKQDYGASCRYVGTTTTTTPATTTPATPTSAPTTKTTTTTTTTRAPTSTTSDPESPCQVANCKQCYVYDKKKCGECYDGYTMSYNRDSCRYITNGSGSSFGTVVATFAALTVAAATAI